jgi:hypothetical protein
MYTATDTDTATDRDKEGILPKKASPASRPGKREKRRAVVRPPVATVQDAPVSTAKTVFAAKPAPSSATAPVSPGRSAWAPVARASGRGGTIRDEDYRYIYSDLRRIGLLAGSILVVLVALTFVLR